MLVLTRKIGQQVVLAGNIEVSVVEIKGNKVRLAFHAPEEVHIRRKEICFEVEDKRPMNLDVATAA
jgi:carbon storage regulator